MGIQAALEHGLPTEILSDNGSQLQVIDEQTRARGLRPVGHSKVVGLSTPQPNIHRRVVSTLDTGSQAGIIGVAMDRVIDLVKHHPMLVAWVALSIGMVAILLYTAKDVELLPTQRLALVLATIGLAGACVWILSWDSDEDSSVGTGEQPK
ncbi:MAG: hypothetical protein M1358_19010 [Chloroflexi bacterium]|nr:hypothetical protein [Chloroflexota bacterium]